MMQKHACSIVCIYKIKDNDAIRPCHAYRSKLLASPQWGVSDGCHKKNISVCACCFLVERFWLYFAGKALPNS